MTRTVALVSCVACSAVGLLVLDFGELSAAVILGLCGLAFLAIGVLR